MKSKHSRRGGFAGAYAALTLGVLTLAPRAAQAAEGERHWLGELNVGAAWLPGGDNFRSAYNLRLGGNYGVFSIGAEFSRYQLSLHDELRDETTSYGVWELFPLVLGLNFDLEGVPLRIGGSAGFGVGVGEEIGVATCTTRNYVPVVLRGRAQAQYVSGSFAAGPFVGYTHDFSEWVGEGCDIGLNGPDPELRDYPDTLPFGVELGLEATLRW